MKTTTLEALREQKAREHREAMYLDRARARQRRRSAQLDEAVGEARALMHVLDCWDEHTRLRLPGVNKVGSRLRLKLRRVVEEHLELVLEEIDALAAGTPFKWPTS